MPARYLSRPRLGSSDVDRIAIIGCGGSGKSHLARQVGSSLGSVVTHLDTEYYDKEWNPLPPDDFAALQRQLVAGQRWVIDGNYASTLPIRLAAADTVVFLDLPARTCLRGVLARQARHGRGQHDAIGDYNRVTANFVRYIWSYRRQMRPRVHNLLAAHATQAEVVVLRSRRAAARWLETVAAQTAVPG